MRRRGLRRSHENGLCIDMDSINYTFKLSLSRCFLNKQEFGDTEEQHNDQCQGIGSLFQINDLK